MDLESESGLSKKCSALQFVISLILPARIGPTAQKNSLNASAMTEGSLKIIFIILREEGSLRFNLFGSTDQIHTVYIYFFYLVAYLSSYREKAIKALYNLA